MSETPEKRKRAPKKPVVIDYELVKRLSHIHCTETEIAYAMDMYPQRLSDAKKNDEKYVAALEGGRAGGRQSLRRLQFEAAAKHNPAMLIWLGKQLLSQTDTVVAHVDAAIARGREITTSALQRNPKLIDEIFACAQEDSTH